MHNNNFKIEERRRKVASMLAQSMTEIEIAEQLNVDQSTICRDIKALKEITTEYTNYLNKIPGTTQKIGSFEFPILPRFVHTADMFLLK
jgi:IS30 family transposase